MALLAFQGFLPDLPAQWVWITLGHCDVLSQNAGGRASFQMSIYYVFNMFLNHAKLVEVKSPKIQCSEPLSP